LDQQAVQHCWSDGPAVRVRSVAPAPIVAATTLVFAFGALTLVLALATG